jgi:excisionase family DNA binding protein
MPTVPKEHRPPLTVKEASPYTGLPERFLRKLIAERRIPFIRVNGTRIRLMPDDLDAWFESQRVEAIQPMAPVRVTRPLTVKKVAKVTDARKRGTE